MKCRHVSSAAILLLLLTACAFDVVRVHYDPVDIWQNDSIQVHRFALTEKAEVSLGTGYTRTLREGTRWNYFGSIPQGDVYKTHDQVLTVEASHVYEAYIVVARSELVGFYLPVEKSFSPVGGPVPLSIEVLN